MPNIKSAKKRVLVNQTKAARNKAAVSAVKTALKKFDAAVAEGTKDEAAVAYKVAVKHVDKAAANGLMHKNKAARKKHQLTIKLNAIEGYRNTNCDALNRLSDTQTVFCWLFFRLSLIITSYLL